MPKRKRNYRPRRGARTVRARIVGPVRRRNRYSLLNRRVRELLASRELKHTTGEINFNCTSMVWNFHDFFQIDQGDTSNTRDGNFVSIKSIEVWLRVTAASGTGVSTQYPDYTNRFVWVWTRKKS